MAQIRSFLIATLLFAVSQSSSAMPIDASVGRLPDQGLKLTPIAEGLFNSGVPDFLQTAWNNTFLVMAYNAQKGGLAWGTAFPIQKMKIGKSNYVLLLTAGHVGKDLSAVRPHTADQLLMASDLDFEKDQAAKPINALRYGPPKMKTDVALDATAILMTLPDDQFSKIVPFQFAQSCQDPVGLKNYVIGFPNVFGRPVANQKVKIANPTTVQKRWSEGLLTADRESDTFQESAVDQYVPLVGTTTDGLGGNSGSPAIDVNGNLIGMLESGKDDSRYTGDESTRPMKTYNDLAPCADLQAFAAQAWTALAPSH